MPGSKAKHPLVGKAPLGSLPAEKGQSAASTKPDYSVGDVVFWGTPTTAGEYTFIGHPRGDKAGKVLVLAMAAEIGFEVDADECAPTDRSNPHRGREYRQRYFRNHPPGLKHQAHGYGVCFSSCICRNGRVSPPCERRP
jgi:hypothetical protein